MIATASTFAVPARQVPRNSVDVVRGLDAFRVEATREVEALFSGVSGKRINGALMPGVTRHSISRALHGCESNPLARLVGWFVLARRIGIPKQRIQRVLDWLQAILDAVYDDAPVAPIEEVLDRDAELDAKDEPVRQRAARGDRAAMVELLELEREQTAHRRIVRARIRAEIGLG